jgi:1-acyl-sn-glycerol-3-phosphate acyltransferase
MKSFALISRLTTRQSPDALGDCEIAPRAWHFSGKQLSPARTHRTYDVFYDTIVLLGRFPFWVSSRPVLLHLERVPRQGAFLIASNHTSHYDIPALMRHTPRNLDFLSVTELFANPLVGWFFSHMNAFPLERSRSDPKTVRIILDRLKRRRGVAMFPEGQLRSEDDSVVYGGVFQPGVARIARLANVPIIPVVAWGTGCYRKFTGWLPLKRSRYGLAFGEPIVVADESEAERQLAQAYRDLYAEIKPALDGSRSA